MADGDPPLEAAYKTCGVKPPKPESAWWMNADQYDAIACPCVLSPGHEGLHACGEAGHPEWAA